MRVMTTISSIRVNPLQQVEESVLKMMKGLKGMVGKPAETAGPLYSISQLLISLFSPSPPGSPSAP
jgi:hypothetical protein